MAIGTLGMLGESTTVNMYIFVYRPYRSIFSSTSCERNRMTVGIVGLFSRGSQWQGGIGCLGKGIRRKTTSKKQTDWCLFKGSWNWHAFCLICLNFVSGKVLSMRYVLTRLGWFVFRFVLVSRSSHHCIKKNRKERHTLCQVHLDGWKLPLFKRTYSRN